MPLTRLIELDDPLGQSMKKLDFLQHPYRGQQFRYGMGSTLLNLICLL